MKKAECEAAIRRLVHDWASEAGVTPGQAEMPSFSAFKSWLQRNRYSGYLDFRATGGADWWVEQWFDEELKQTWRN